MSHCNMIGTKERKIPYPTGNPMTLMFNFVSCPNYTYETGAWLAYAVMTQCLPGMTSPFTCSLLYLIPIIVSVVFFLLAGFYQMAVWAKGKHRNYKRDFSDYPRRKAILPFLL